MKGVHRAVKGDENPDEGLTVSDLVLTLLQLLYDRIMKNDDEVSVVSLVKVFEPEKAPVPITVENLE